MIAIAFMATAAIAAPCGAEVSHAERMACAAKRLGDADKKLETAWHLYFHAMEMAARRVPEGGTWAPSTEKAERHLADRYLGAVRQAQARFAAFLDAQCLGEGFPARGGSGSDDPIIACKIELTEAQTARLAALTAAIR